MHLCADFHAGPSKEYLIFFLLLLKCKLFFFYTQFWFKSLEEVDPKRSVFGKQRLNGTFQVEEKTHLRQLTLQAKCKHHEVATEARMTRSAKAKRTSVPPKEYPVKRTSL